VIIPRLHACTHPEHGKRRSGILKEKYSQCRRKPHTTLSKLRRLGTKIPRTRSKIAGRRSLMNMNQEEETCFLILGGKRHAGARSRRTNNRVNTRGQKSPASVENPEERKRESPPRPANAL
jgi:hypothetical protein